jgi:beta-phosphoglucomutase-like phosphatase (HAD superfamily)
MVTKLGGGMSRSVRVALFDVDGTLVDTNYLHAVTWWEAFTQAGYQPAMADIHRAIGMGSDQMLDKLLPADRDKDADADVRAAHSALYATYWSRLRPLPGAADLLRACKQRGLAVVLASSADEPEFNALRGALDAEDAIDAATFAGDVESSKPRPGPDPGGAGEGRHAGRRGSIHRRHGLGCTGLPEGQGPVHRPAERWHQR